MMCQYSDKDDDFDVTDGLQNINNDKFNLKTF